MADIQHMRAHRFDALYQLLTGVACAKLPLPYDGSDHLRADIGLPDVQSARTGLVPFGSVAENPFRITL